VFLEIWFHIFKNFTPSQIMFPEQGEKDAQQVIVAQERQRE